MKKKLLVSMFVLALFQSQSYAVLDENDPVLLRFEQVTQEVYLQYPKGFLSNQEIITLKTEALQRSIKEYTGTKVDIKLFGLRDLEAAIERAKNSTSLERPFDRCLRRELINIKKHQYIHYLVKLDKIGPGINIEKHENLIENLIEKYRTQIEEAIRRDTDIINETVREVLIKAARGPTEAERAQAEAERAQAEAERAQAEELRMQDEARLALRKTWEQLPLHFQLKGKTMEEAVELYEKEQAAEAEWEEKTRQKLRMKQAQEDLRLQRVIERHQLFEQQDQEAPQEALQFARGDEAAEKTANDLFWSKVDALCEGGMCMMEAAELLKAKPELDIKKELKKRGYQIVAPRPDLCSKESMAAFKANMEECHQILNEAQYFPPSIELTKGKAEEMSKKLQRLVESGIRQIRAITLLNLNPDLDVEATIQEEAANQ